MIFAQKSNKMPEFYTIFARKTPEFYIIIARKIFFPIFFLGGGDVPPCPTPVSYACAPTPMETSDRPTNDSHERMVCTNASEPKPNCNPNPNPRSWHDVLVGPGPMPGDALVFLDAEVRCVRCGISSYRRL